MSYKINTGFIPTDHGNLETISFIPQNFESVMIVAHPHPMHGGNMNNKVVYTLANLAQQNGLYSIRFNFRGVGKSTGQYDNGIGEVHDFRRVINFVLKEIKPERIFLSGFSFGSRILMKILEEGFEPSGIIFAGLPIEFFKLMPLKTKMHSPVLLIQGENDEFTSESAATTFIEQSHFENVRLQIIPKCDHFFTGKIHELSFSVNGFLKQMI